MWITHSSSHVSAEISGMEVHIRKGSFLKGIPGNDINFHSDLFYPIVNDGEKMIVLPHARTIGRAKKIAEEMDYSSFKPRVRCLSI